MKTLILAVAMAACAVGQANADPAADALKARAEDCIRSGAPGAAARAGGLQDAVGFVLELCSVEVGRVDAYDTSSRTLEDWRGRSSAAQLVGVTIDPATGELKTPPGFKMEWSSSATTLNDLHRVTPRMELVAFAARAVIASRKPVSGQ